MKTIRYALMTLLFLGSTFILSAQSGMTICSGGAVTVNGNLSIIPSLPTSGLVAYYPFNGNADDESGNGNNGIVTGATLTTDRFGNANSAYSFDGVNNNRIVVPNSTSINMASGNMSMSYWIKWLNSDDDLNYRGISKAGDGYSLTTGYELIIRGSCWGDNGCIGFNLPNSTGTPYMNAWNTNQYRGQWINLVGSFNNGIGKLYLNGVLFSTGPVGLNTVVPNNYDLYIGPRNPAAAFAGQLDGSIDDIRIYNRALTDAEIQALYHEGGLAK